MPCHIREFHCPKQGHWHGQCPVCVRIWSVSEKLGHHNGQCPTRCLTNMTATWQQFASQAPELAALGEAQFARTGLALVGDAAAGRVAAHLAGGAVHRPRAVVLGDDVAVGEGARLAARPPLRGAQHGVQPGRHGGASSRSTGAPSKSPTWTSGGGSATRCTPPSDSGLKSRSSTASPSPSKAWSYPCSATASFTAKSGLGKINARTQRRHDAKIFLFFFASLRPCVKNLIEHEHALAGGCAVEGLEGFDGLSRP